MTISEKVEQAANSTIFTLYKEGIFYKCYNEDAMAFVNFFRTSQDYNILQISAAALVFFNTKF